MAEPDDKARFMRALAAMRADGAGDDRIASFVQKYKTERGARAQMGTLTAPGQGPWAGAEPLTVAPEAPGDTPGETGANSKYGNPNMVRDATRGMDDTQKREFRAQGLGAMAGMAAGGTLGLLFAGPAAGAGLLGRTVLSAAAGAGAGEVEGATTAAVEGKSAADVLASAGEHGETGALLGASGHLLGEAGGAIAGKLRGGDGWLARFLRAQDAGAYKDPAMQALPKGTKGLQKAAEKAHGDVTAKGLERDAAASAKYQDALNGPDYTPPAEDNPLFAAAAARDRPPRMLEALPDDRLPSAPFPRERPPQPPPLPPEPPGSPLQLEDVPQQAQLGPMTDRGARYEVTPGGRARRPGATEAELPPGEVRPHGGDGGELTVRGEQGMGQSQRLPRTEQEYIPPEGAPREPGAAEAPRYTPGEAPGVSYEAPTKGPAPEAPGQTPVATGLGRTVDRNAMLSELRAGRVANIVPDTRMPADKAVDKAYREAIKALGGKGTVNTVGGTLKLRRALMAKANFSSPNPTPEERAARHVYQTFRSAVRKAAPDVAAADDAYAAHARGRARESDILTGSEDPAVRPPPEAEAEPSDITPAPEDPQMRVAKEQAGTRRLKREGDTNEPGNNAQKYLDELRAQEGAGYAEALDFIANKKALEATRFGAPHLATDLKGANAHFAGVPLRYAAQYGRATAAHVGDPAARAIAKLKAAAPYSGTVANRLFDAKDKDRERAKRRADALGE